MDWKAFSEKYVNFIMDFIRDSRYDIREVIGLKTLNRKIESFCFRHPRFGIPRLMLYIVIGNILVYLVGMMDTTNTLYSLLYFDPARFLHGEVWRLVTFVLVPSSSGILWLAISLYFYYFIGSALEREWGAGKFTIYYLSGLLITALYAVIWYLITRKSVVITAHYLNLSLFFAFATLWPEQQVLLFFVIPVKMKWLAWIDAAFFVYEMIVYFSMGAVGQALVPLVAMIAYLIFCGEWLFDLFSPKTVRQKTRTIRFKDAVRRAEKKKQAEDAVRRCAVCGRSELDSPGMEFRFCSRCAGYHCFCAEHINNHIHFTE